MLVAERLYHLTGHSGAVYALARGHEPDILFSGGADKVVASWNLSTGESSPFAIRLDASVYAMHHHQAENLLYVGQSAGGLHVIDLAERKEVRLFKIHERGIFHLQPDVDRNRLYASGADGCLSVWQLESPEFVRNIPLSDHKLRSSALSPDGQWLAVAVGDASIRILDTENLNEHYTISAHDPGAHAIAWHPDGDYLITGGRDAHIRVWDVKAGFTPVLAVPAHNFAIYGLCFHPEGKWLASASRDKTIKIWDPNQISPLLRIERPAHRAHQNSVNTLSWSLHKDHLISASDDKSIIGWRISEA